MYRRQQQYPKDQLLHAKNITKSKIFRQEFLRVCNADEALGYTQLYNDPVDLQIRTSRHTKCEMLSVARARIYLLFKYICVCRTNFCRKHEIDMDFIKVSRTIKRLVTL